MNMETAQPASSANQAGESDQARRFFGGQGWSAGYDSHNRMRLARCNLPACHFNVG